RARAELARRARGVAPERERRAVGLGREHAHRGIDQHETVPHQPEVVDHGLPQPADGVDDAGSPHARRDLDRVQDPAGPLSPLEHEDTATGLREVRSRDQTVVARPDDDRVVLGHHATTFRPGLGNRSDFSTSRAAIRPGAPMMPPPGWVAEPQSHRSLTGVRYLAHPGTGRLKKSCSSESSPWKMLPSVRPVISSMSSGVTTCLWMMRSRILGNRSSSVSITASPNAVRISSSQTFPSARWYGAHCTKQLMMCLPGGAIAGSTSGGMMQSMYGRREKLTYFASSYARSM